MLRPIVTRRRGVFGEFGIPVFWFAANVNTLAMGLSDPADCGGVNVKADAVDGGIAELINFVSGWAVVGVESGNAELGVSGYVMEKGPGV